MDIIFSSQLNKQKTSKTGSTNSVTKTHKLEGEVKLQEHLQDSSKLQPEVELQLLQDQDQDSASSEETLNTKPAVLSDLTPPVIKPVPNLLLLLQNAPVKKEDQEQSPPVPPAPPALAPPRPPQADLVHTEITPSEFYFKLRVNYSF